MKCNNKIAIIGAGCSDLHSAVINRIGGIQFTKRIDPAELGQPGFEIRNPDADFSGLNVTHVFIDEAACFSTQEQEKRKDVILTDLYKTGRLDGFYFGRDSKSKKNPIKHYIKSCMFKQRIDPDESLIEDCYNEMFENLCKKPAYKICEIYDESPKKLIATALKIIALKCFAIDPRYNNPRHSFIQSTFHNSAKSENAVNIFDVDTLKDNQVEDNRAYNNKNGKDKRSYDQSLLKDKSHDPSDFFNAYGFEIEDLIERLNPQQRADFYECIGKQKRGKVSAPVQAKRDELFEIIKELKNKMVN